jgi:hypothetical protein
VPVTLFPLTATSLHESDEAEQRNFLHLFDVTLARFRPDVLVTSDDGPVGREILARAPSAFLHDLELPKQSRLRIILDGIFWPPRKALALRVRMGAGAGLVTVPLYTAP